MDIQPVINFFTQWAFLPASAGIIAIVAWQKKNGFLDFKKFRWLMALIWGLIFAVGQKYVAPALGYPAIQSEWAKAIMMGFCTGLVPVLVHSIFKNTKQAVKNGHKDPPRIT